MSRILLLILFSCISLQQVVAQCCAAGNPSSSGGGLGLKKNSLTFSTFYQHSFSDTYYEGNSASDWEYLSHSNFDFSLISFSYGLTDKIQLSTELGYFIDKSLGYIFSDFGKKANGFGDGALSLQYNLYSNKEKLLSISPSIKLTFPIGEFNKVVDGVVLPIDFQPSSGSMRYNPALIISKRFFGSKFSLQSYTSVVFSNRITKRSKYKYGNLYNLSITAAYQLNPKLNTALQVKNIYREKANDITTNQEVIIMESTGGHYINLSPQIRYSFLTNYSLTTALDIPVYRNVNGTQLVNKYAFSLRISKSFGLGQKKIQQTDFINLSQLLEHKIEVNGICNMCKDRIETIAYKVKNIKWAEWDLESKSLLLKYEEEFDLNKLARKLSNAGHDNAILKAEDKAYNNLHSCCKYRSINNH